MSAKQRDILEYLIRNKGNVVTYELIYDRIWGILDDDADEHRLIKQQIYHIKKSFPMLAACIESHDKLGYSIHLPKDYRVIFEPEDEDVAEDPETAQQVATGAIMEEKLPARLTRTGAPYADEEMFIHRGQEIEELEQILRERKTAVMISGFGGVGKTTVARLLWSRLADEFDSVGWVEYHGNLKDSLLASLTLYPKLDDRELRFQHICDRLKNDRTRKLLFIDNVDSDKACGQDPQKDALFSEISGWPNLTVILTSRFDKLRGYRSYRLRNLTPDDCEDLFYYYYNEWEYETPKEDRNMRSEVRELIDLAGYHTYAIELLAKSAFAQPLDVYLQKVREMGFRFPELNVQTDHRNAYANAAGQLKKLFDMSTRTEAELRILWDFSVLPNLELSAEEVKQWMGYTINDLTQLIREGWLLFRQGFSMHPLIKETMHLDLVNGKAPKGTMEHLLLQILEYKFLSEFEVSTYTGAKRKLAIAEHVLQLIPIPEEEEFEEIQMSLEFWLASCYNNLGYFLSYTNTGRKEAVGYLRKALKMRRQLELRYPGTGLNRDDLATSCDYLGYLLSDQEDEKEEAEALLIEALAVRTSLEEEYPNKYIADVAWTLDNLGYLLSSEKSRKEEAEVRLKEALKIRQKLEELHPGEHAAEVGWTCNNLGQLLQSDGTRFEEAEEYYRLALEHCGKCFNSKYIWEVADSAILQNNLATLLQRHPERNGEAERLYREALETMKSVEEDHREMYPLELLICCHNLLVFLKRLSNAEAEIHTLREDMMRISNELEQMYPGVYDDFLREIHAEDSFYIQSGSRKQKVPVLALERELSKLGL
ncbi:MAG: tetratricopeptide repeat protein [Firmicutes bacterium]|nr:tetratricopeptide repeat protein [Bacillota bacterium]